MQRTECSKGHMEYGSYDILTRICLGRDGERSAAAGATQSSAHSALLRRLLGPRELEQRELRSSRRGGFAFHPSRHGTRST